MAVQQKTQQKSGPDFKLLGLKSPMEVIDLLALLHIDGEPVISNESVILNPALKAKAVMEYFENKFGIRRNDLPYLASIIKRDLKSGKIGWGNR